jgi:hypothetical protein
MKLFNGFVICLSQLSSRDLCFYITVLCLFFMSNQKNILTTPGGVEDNEGIFVRIEYGGLEVGSH